MGALVDIVGQRFSRLVVLARKGAANGKATWLCDCDCGTRVAIKGDNLKRGVTSSCGCLHSELVSAHYKELNRTHGGTKTREYKSWQQMRDRCGNPNSHAWKWYGGRGITVCERWSQFENFLADMGPRPDAMSLDRIDVNGNYEPGNCRWATALEQNRNRRKKVH